MTLMIRDATPLFKRLFAEAVKPHLGRLVLAGLFLTLVAGATAATAWLMDPVVNEVFIGQDRGALWWVGAAVIATFLVKSVASYASETVIAFVGQRIVADLQARLFRHLISHDAAVIQSRHSAGLMSHFTYDITALRQAVSSAMVGLGRDSLSVIFLAGVMIHQDWLLSLIVLAVAPLSAWPIQRLGRSMRKVSSHLQGAMAGFATSLSEAFQGARMIQSYRLEEAEIAEKGRQIEELFRLNVDQARLRAAMQPVIDTISGFAIGGVILYGGFRVIEGDTTPGAFFSFVAAVLMAYQPLRALGKINAYVQEGLAAAGRIYGVLDTPRTILEPPEPKELPHQAGAIRFEDVSFRYGEEPALTEVSLVAEAGRVTALVGPSGAGKSTILALIPRFFDPVAGRVTVNGVATGEASLASLRNRIAWVGQEIVLFDDSVRANIAHGRPGASEAEIIEAAKAAAAHDFIQELPEGYATRVGENGLRLSGGQRQRLAIARAILKDAPILLLDEATSALDTESERAVRAALDRLQQGRTTLVIAHRLSTVIDADRIYALEAGRVVEQGDHHSLLAAGGLYARLFGAQAGG